MNPVKQFHRRLFWQHRTARMQANSGACPAANHGNGHPSIAEGDGGATCCYRMAEKKQEKYYENIMRWHRFETKGLKTRA